MLKYLILLNQDKFHQFLFIQHLKSIYMVRNCWNFNLRTVYYNITLICRFNYLRLTI